MTIAQIFLVQVSCTLNRESTSCASPWQLKGILACGGPSCDHSIPCPSSLSPPVRQALLPVAVVFPFLTHLVDPRRVGGVRSLKVQTKALWTLVQKNRYAHTCPSHTAPTQKVPVVWDVRLSGAVAVIET